MVRRFAGFRKKDRLRVQHASDQQHAFLTNKNGTVAAVIQENGLVETEFFPKIQKTGGNLWTTKRPGRSAEVVAALCRSSLSDGGGGGGFAALGTGGTVGDDESTASYTASLARIDVVAHRDDQEEDGEDIETIFLEPEHRERSFEFSEEGADHDEDHTLTTIETEASMLFPECHSAMVIAQYYFGFGDFANRGKLLEYDDEDDDDDDDDDNERDGRGRSTESQDEIFDSSVQDKKFARKSTPKVSNRQQGRSSLSLSTSSSGHTDGQSLTMIQQVPVIADDESKKTPYFSRLLSLSSDSLDEANAIRNQTSATSAKSTSSRVDQVLSRTGSFPKHRVLSNHANDGPTLNASNYSIKTSNTNSIKDALSAKAETTDKNNSSGITTVKTDEKILNKQVSPFADEISCNDNATVSTLSTLPKTDPATADAAPPPSSALAVIEPTPAPLITIVYSFGAVSAAASSAAASFSNSLQIAPSPFLGKNSSIVEKEDCPEDIDRVKTPTSPLPPPVLSQKEVQELIKDDARDSDVVQVYDPVLDGNVSNAKRTKRGFLRRLREFGRLSDPAAKNGSRIRRKNSNGQSIASSSSNQSSSSWARMTGLSPPSSPFGSRRSVSPLRSRASPSSAQGTVQRIAPVVQQANNVSTNNVASTNDAATSTATTALIVPDLNESGASNIMDLILASVPSVVSQGSLFGLTMVTEEQTESKSVAESVTVVECTEAEKELKKEEQDTSTKCESPANTLAMSPSPPSKPVTPSLAKTEDPAPTPPDVVPDPTFSMLEPSKSESFSIEGNEIDGVEPEADKKCAGKEGEGDVKEIKRGDTYATDPGEKAYKIAMSNLRRGMNLVRGRSIGKKDEAPTALETEKPNQPEAAKNAEPDTAAKPVEPEKTLERPPRPNVSSVALGRSRSAKVFRPKIAMPRPRSANTRSTSDKSEMTPGSRETTLTLDTDSLHSGLSFTSGRSSVLYQETDCCQPYPVHHGHLPYRRHLSRDSKKSKNSSGSKKPASPVPPEKSTIQTDTAMVNHWNEDDFMATLTDDDTNVSSKRDNEFHENCCAYKDDFSEEDLLYAKEIIQEQSNYSSETDDKELVGKTLAVDNNGQAEALADDLTDISSMISKNNTFRSDANTTVSTRGTGKGLTRGQRILSTVSTENDSTTMNESNCSVASSAFVTIEGGDEEGIMPTIHEGSGQLDPLFCLLGAPKKKVLRQPALQNLTSGGKKTKEEEDTNADTVDAPIGRQRPRRQKQVSARTGDDLFCVLQAPRGPRSLSGRNRRYSTGRTVCHEMTSCG